MAERKKSLVLIILTLFLFSLTIILVWFLIRFKQPQISSFAYYLNKFDSSFAMGTYKAAEDSLNKASAFPQNGRDWYRLIKRSFMISKETGDWSLYHQYSERALTRFQGNNDFWAFYVSSLIWTGQYDELLKYKDRISIEKYPTLIAEMRLIEESLAIDETVKPYQGVINRLDTEKDARFYSLIADISRLDGLYVDAALLWMGLGEYGKAIDQLENITQKDDYAQLIGLTYWDAEDLDSSLYYLTRQNEMDIANHNSRWTLNNILADGFYLTGDWERAEAYYKQSGAIMKNWRSLVNRALLKERIGLFKGASEILFDVIEEYPFQKEVVNYFIENWAETYPVKAERVINNYLDHHPDDYEMKLKNLLYFPQEMIPERYHTFLWSLFNEDSKSEAITRYLLWYLIGMGDYDSVDIVIERHVRSVQEEPDWIGLYKGITYLLDDPPQLNRAYDSFNQYHNLHHDKYGKQNLITLLNFLGKYDEIEQLKGDEEAGVKK